MQRVRAALLCAIALLLAACRVPGARDASAPRPLLDSTVLINGVRQHVLVRGSGTTPLLVIVHGGPGVDENPLFRHYVPSLEAQFTVVYWQQRGTGRSYAPDLEPAGMTIPQITADLAALVEMLCRQYGQERVVLLAHSWGTIPAALYAQSHPQRVSAYISIGQMADVPASELHGWQWALDQARERGNDKAFQALSRIGPPPHDVDAMLLARRWTERFGGTFHGAMRTRDLIGAALADDEVGITDVIRFGRGNRFSLEHLWPQIRSFRLDASRRWEVPVVLMSGRYDRVTSYDVVTRFFGQLDAPCKTLVTFEASAHNPPFEEPEAFARWLRTDFSRWLRGCEPRRAVIGS